MTSYYLNYPFKGPNSKYGYIQKYCRLGLQYMNWGAEEGHANAAPNSFQK